MTKKKSKKNIHKEKSAMNVEEAKVDVSENNDSLKDSQSVENVDKELKHEEVSDSNSTEETQESEEQKVEETKEEQLERELKESKDKYLRISAEFDNYRKRTLKERMDMLKTASEDVLVNLLPLVDNFERALKTMETAEDVAAVKEGIELIYKNFVSFLDQRGMKEIEAIGKEFDTDLHEAITKIPAPSEELKGKIVDVIEKGYKLHEKVSRYCKVVIGE